ncbi:Uu.00g053210.m01.CDS01 [Anthostomella pinea]|uniref:Uu.00g053210.m01.CDS01 n=1 Tax=Anthostomella pinea TaxID=933095 RepID=A0AAI8YPM3_9PEZI|nr:Uu.00g053210.m01.CDS01 [Anthostomella pinea]
MSDQDTKPVEAVDTPIAPAEVKSVESEFKQETTSENPKADEEMVGAPAVNTEPIADVKVEVREETEPNAEDKDSTKDEKDAGETKPVGPSIFNPPANMLKVRRNKHHGKPFTKPDPVVLPDSDDPEDIRKQVHFYFSDSNLPGDKYMWGQTGGEENKPVPVSKIASFARMRRFKPYTAVINALKASSFLVVEGAEGEETVRRKNAYDPSKKLTPNQVIERSVYVKGFGEGEPDTQIQVEAFFSQFGEYSEVRLRKDDKDIEHNKPFKGSVFVQWADKETAEKFMALDPKPQWKQHDLLILWKQDYMDQKAQAIREGKLEPMDGPSRSHRGRGGRGRGRGQSRGNHRGGDSDDWKKRREQDQQNGFRDNNGRGRGRGRARGRGRGRGRDGHENGDRHVKQEDEQPRDDGRPKIHTSKEGAKAMAEAKAKETETNGKRAREEDGAAGEPPAKKVDTKEGAATDAA